MNLAALKEKLDGPIDPSDPYWPHLVARGLHSYFASVPAAVCSNIVIALLVLTICWDVTPAFVSACWFGAAIILLAARLQLKRSFRRDGEIDNPLKTRNSIISNTAAIAVLWALAIAWMCLKLPASRLVMFPIVAAGMMNAGALTLHSIPRAALSWITIIALGAAVGAALLGTGIGYVAIAMLLAYYFLLVQTILVNFSYFVDRAISDYQARTQADTVKLLLRDYEERGSDWLWYVDTAGRLMDASRRFAEASGRSTESLSQMDFVALFDEGLERNALFDHLRHLRPFTDLTLPLMVGGETRWWTISAKLRFGPDGATVIGLHGVATDVTSTHVAETKIAFMAHHDGLTGLPNRILLDQELGSALKYRKDGHYVAVMCLDLDNFKSVNDVHGHPIGDELLRVVARRLNSFADENCLVARLGGDEFAILMTEVKDPRSAKLLADQIVEQMTEAVDLESHQLLAAASIGIAFAPDNGKTAADILKNADLALYRAKGNGRNQYCFFDPSMSEAINRRQTLENDLRRAIQQDEFVLYYQPIVDARTRKICTAEALIRWKHPTKGLIPPDQFIPVAEDTGLITQIGEWVLHTACREATKWPADVKVAVNLSAVQFRKSNLPDVIMYALAETGLPPERLELEITETAFIESFTELLPVLRMFKNLGIAVALDDFGTGYSSLRQLTIFPFDKIKIDKSFTQGLTSNAGCAAGVAAVITLARTLDLVITAEGVETMQQFKLLQGAGIHQMQGYLFKRPGLPSELDFERIHDIQEDRNAA